MANVNDGKILGRMMDEINPREFPWWSRVFKGTGKRFVAAVTLGAVLPIVIAAATNFFSTPLPRVNNDFGERRRNNH